MGDSRLVRVVDSLLEAVVIVLLGVLVAIPVILAVVAWKTGSCSRTLIAGIVVALLFAVYGLLEYYSHRRR